jgi:hypothetical protein
MDLEGIAVRRHFGYEKKNRQGKHVYIESEILAALGPCDLNFQVNLALEHMLTKHPDWKVLITARRERSRRRPLRATRRS